MKTPEQKTAEALTFLRSNTGGVLSTLSSDGTPSGAFVYYVADADFNIYVATFAESHKYQNIQINSKVAFTVAFLYVPQTVQMEGVATEVTSEPDVVSVTAELIRIFTVNQKYYSPPAAMARMWEGLKIIKITPSWIRWGDFTTGIGAEAFYTIKQ